MYQKYQTEAIVCAGSLSGEADKIFALYTRDFGLVRARATGVRLEKSKMRYALQTHARAEIGLVRGKRGWRVAGARSFGGVRTHAREGARAFARMSGLLLRLIAGEEENNYLFESLAGAHEVLSRVNTQTDIIEVVAIARMLYALGYISTENLDTELFRHARYEDGDLAQAIALRAQLQHLINHALSQTHLVR